MEINKTLIIAFVIVEILTIVLYKKQKVFRIILGILEFLTLSFVTFYSFPINLEPQKRYAIS